MAAPEELFQTPKEYKEPDPSKLRWAKGREIPEGWMMRGIYSGVIHIEPVQEGVHRYPPVQVDVPRRPEFIAKYIDLPNQPPTQWPEVFKAKKMPKFIDTKNAGPVKLPDETR